MTASLLEITDLNLSLPHSKGLLSILRGVSFTLHKGEIVGLVGESGCGKSLTASAIMGFLPPASQLSGSIQFRGRPLHTASQNELNQLRGSHLSLILQDPGLALNPMLPIGLQLTEGVRRKEKLSHKQGFTIGVEWLARVGITDPDYRMQQYPHQLSGGMKQRVMIAMALICNPPLLIADEPTTALDVTTQLQILELLRDLQQEKQTGILLITHDLGVVAQICHRVLVMHEGRIVEAGSTDQILTSPQHPYTKSLLASKKYLERFPNKLSLPCENEATFTISSVEASELCSRVKAAENKPLLEIAHLSKYFRQGKQTIHALNEVSFSLKRGEIVGIGGESGCGKSTLGKLLMGLIEPTTGSICFDGQDLLQLSKQHSQAWRQKMQMVFQHPAAALNPRFTVEQTLAEPFIIHRQAQCANRTASLLRQVGLSEDYLKRLPHELSGGQKQRVAIARALALNPSLVICDEPFSALDVSIQAQIIDLLAQLQRNNHLSLLIISHDLSILRYLSDRLGIMYAGQFVEWGPSEAVYADPLHPYTQMLVSAILTTDSKHPMRKTSSSQPLRLLQPSQGCSFYSRCPQAKLICQQTKPPWREVSPGRFTACHL